MIPSSTICEMFRFVSEYAFRLKDVNTTIKIRIYESLDADMKETGIFVFSQSHFLRTPVQMDAYITSDMTGESEKRALAKALLTLTMYYEDAVRSGHEPKESWLVANDHF